MKKTIIAILLVFVAVITLTGCNSNKKTEPNNSNNNKNQTAEVVVDITGGIPYEWVYSISDSKIVKYKDMTEESSGAIGGSTQQHYTFEGLKEGKTTIKFELKSITDDTVDQTKNYDVVVDKNLKVTITEK